MKRYLILLLAVLLLASPTPARAQEYTAPPVEISKEKVRLDGKIYYSHVVQEKQTLYSICKAYGVTLEDVFRSNPSLNLEKEGLKKDQIILIPIPEEEKAPEQSNTKVKRKLKVDDPEAEAAAKKAAQEKAARAAEEKAAKAEERAARAAEEKAKAEERAAAAAQAAEERAAKAAEEKAAKAAAQEKAAEEKAAKAAAQEKAVEEKAAAQAAADPGEVLTGDEDYTYHRVKWFEDMSSIAAKYGVSPASIRGINGLASDKLVSRQLLKIPKHPADWEKADPMAGLPAGVTVPARDAGTEDTPVEKAEEATGDAQEEDAAEDTAAEEAPAEEDPFLFEDIFAPAKHKDVQAALLVPVGKSGKTNTLMLDFYCGALMAARDLGRQGVNVVLNAYDYASGKMPLSAEEFENTDFVIGPVDNADILETLRQSDGASWIVSPLDQKGAALADTLAQVIQAPSGTADQIADLVDWLQHDYEEGDKVVLLMQKGGEDASFAQAVAERMRDSGLTYTTLEFTRQESGSILSTMGNLVNSYGTGRFILASETESFAIEVVRNLFLLSHRNAKVALYATSKIRTFDAIEVDQLHDVNLHADVSYFVDYRNGNVHDFIQGYRALFNTEPSQFAFQGYDIMKSLSLLKGKYGKKWIRTLDKVTVKGLQADYKYVRRPDGGFVNTATRRVIYTPDRRIVSAD